MRNGISESILNSTYVNFLFLCVCVCTADNVMNGVFLEVSNAEVPVCVSFECITDSGEMVVLAHHIGDDDGDGDDDTEKLSAYNLNATNNCVTSLAIGSYSVGVFMVKNDRTLVAPPTHLTSSSASTLTFCTPGK